MIRKKIKFTLGSGISEIKFKLENIDANTVNNYSFLNHTPVAVFYYQPKTHTNINFRYIGNTVQPGIDQLQPLRNNNDPLNIFIGNPDLKVGFTNDFSVGYGMFKLLKQRYVHFALSYRLNKNAIVFENSIDEKGLRTYRPINVNGNNNLIGNVYYLWGIGDNKVNQSINYTVSTGNNVAFINNNRSNNGFLNTNISYSASYNIRDKLGIQIEPKLGYNKMKSSLQTTVNNNYFTYGASGRFFVMLPFKLELVTDFNADLRQKIAAFERNNNILLFNAELARKIFKDKSGKITVHGFDIFNQNRGYNRNINNNFVTDEYYSQISRYFMLKFEWTFNKMLGLVK